ncbi:hypothetical protein HZ326_5675 [Fusarium oxysporum f. sp. albedinis]|nr:hypothetical protein HZ326_5675 [Fusarium oxysporum f. sp. albedinis]
MEISRCTMSNRDRTIPHTLSFFSEVSYLFTGPAFISGVLTHLTKHLTTPWRHMIAEIVLKSRVKGSSQQANKGRLSPQRKSKLWWLMAGYAC